MTALLQILVLLTLGQHLADAASLLEVLYSNNLTFFANGLSSLPSLQPFLSDITDITLFVPTDQAWASWLGAPNGTNETDLSNSNISDAEMAAILSYHILPGVYPAGSFSMNATVLPTYLASSLYSNVSGAQKVAISGNDPDAINLATGWNDCYSLVTDIAFDGGIIHTFDSPLVIPPPLQQGLTKMKDLFYVPEGSYDDTGGAAMLEALEAADLVSEIQSMKDVTVLIPFNSAFYNVGSIFDGMSVDTLRSILRYHIIPNTPGLMSKLLDVDTGSRLNISLQSLQGTNLNLAWYDSQWRVGVDAALSSIEGDGLSNLDFGTFFLANGIAFDIWAVLNPDMAGGHVKGDAAPILFPGATKIAYSQQLFTNIIGKPSSATTSGASSTATNGGTSPLHQSGSLPTGAKIGIAVGGALVVVAFVALLAWFMIKRRKSAASKVSASSSNEEKDEIAKGEGQLPFELESGPITNKSSDMKAPLVHDRPELPGTQQFSDTKASLVPDRSELHGTPQYLDTKVPMVHDLSELHGTTLVSSNVTGPLVHDWPELHGTMVGGSELEGTTVRSESEEGTTTLPSELEEGTTTTRSELGEGIATTRSELEGEHVGQRQRPEGRQASTVNFGEKISRRPKSF